MRVHPQKGGGSGAMATLAWPCPWMSSEHAHDPADWKWSSYRFHEFGDRSVPPLDLDGRLPIEW